MPGHIPLHFGDSLEGVLDQNMLSFPKIKSLQNEITKNLDLHLKETNNIEKTKNVQKKGELYTASPFPQSERSLNVVPTVEVMIGL